jgi:hypothetical protein
MKLQWHTQPPPSIENTSDLEWQDVNLDEKVESNQRLEEFGYFLREQGYVPPQPFKSIGDFLTNGTKLQIMGALSYNWNRKQDKVRLVPQRTYQFPKYTYGLNDSLVYRCCGYPRNHPGCWTGPVLYEYTKFKVNLEKKTVVTGTYWKTNDPTSRIKAILNKGDPENDLEYMMLKEEFQIEEEKASPPPPDSPPPDSSRPPILPPDSPPVFRPPPPPDSPPPVFRPPTPPASPPPPPSPPALSIAELIKRAKSYKLYPENIAALETLNQQLGLIDPGNNKIQKIIRKIKTNSVPVFKTYMDELKAGRFNINMDDPKLFPDQKEKLREEREQWAVTDSKYKKLAEGDGFGGTVGLKWRANSCWIDTIFTSLFLLKNTSIIREILESPKRLTFNEGGCIAQDYHDAFLNDIETLQTVETKSGVPSKLRKLWSKCISNKVIENAFGSPFEFISSIQEMYDLKTLNLQEAVFNGNVKSDWIYINQSRRYPLDIDEYTRTALIVGRRNKGHFLTILYDPIRDTNTFINLNLSYNDVEPPIPEDTIVCSVNRKEEFEFTDLDEECQKIENVKNLPITLKKDSNDDDPPTYEPVGAVYMRYPKNINVDNILSSQPIINAFNDYKAFIERFYRISIWKKFDFAAMQPEKRKICLGILLKIAQKGQVSRYEEAERRILDNDHEAFGKVLSAEDVKPEVKPEVVLQYVMGAVNDI